MGIIPISRINGDNPEWHEVFRNRCPRGGIDKNRPPWDKDWGL
jgi:hypothetical protein